MLKKDDPNRILLRIITTISIVWTIVVSIPTAVVGFVFPWRVLPAIVNIACSVYYLRVTKAQHKLERPSGMTVSNVITWFILQVVFQLLMMDSGFNSYFRFLMVIVSGHWSLIPYVGDY